ncbi:MAG: ATP-binding protein [Deltaproteobacteria bacterium]|nr:ATP-binding protein [Deltaproteobacteria bacterium]
MRLVVASGKGGTGKTLVSTHLAWLAAERGLDVTYADVDVETPNGHLFLAPVVEREHRHTVLLPSLPFGHCTGCGVCHDFCQYNAILPLPDSVLIFPELCHNCGGCVRVCPPAVLSEVPHEVGTVREGRAGNLRFLDGRVDVGEPRATPLIQEVLRRIDAGTLAVVDAPPGTSCNTTAALSGADRVLLVTEPTPFGLHDLRLALQLCRTAGLPAGVVINRADLGDDRPLRAFLEAERVPVRAAWRYDPELAVAVARGELAGRRVPWFRDAVEHLLDACLAPQEDGRS